LEKKWKKAKNITVGEKNKKASSRGENSWEMEAINPS